MKIKRRIINNQKPPFIIAEMSGNHNQSLERALKIVKEAKNAGADAIKLQTYTPETITLKSDRKEFFISSKKNIWKGQTLHSLYSKGFTPWEWHEKIFNYANNIGLICFSSPFDESAVDFLTKLKVPAFKIASFENNHLPLINKIAKTNKPIIMSTGMASLKELTEAVNIIKKNSSNNLALLKCTSTYPADPKNNNLNTIIDLKKRFKCEVGLSDHTLGNSVALTSIGIGATIVEKHFTLDRSEGGVDSKFSLEPKEFKKLVTECKESWIAKGEFFYGPTNDEKVSTKFRRSIYAKKNISKNEKFTKENIVVIRPANGLHPRYYFKLIGKRAKKNIKYSEPLKLSMIK